MMVFNLSENNSILNNFLFELRDRDIQKDRFRFRRNLERIGEIMAYEISKTLNYVSKSATTPLAETEISIIDEQPVLITILRAGIPFFQGIQNVFDKADAGFIAAFREENGQEVKINLSYIATNSLEGRTILIVDPMLATGKSLVDSISAMKINGTPKHIHIAAVIAAPEGIEYIKANVQEPWTLWVAAIDDELNDKYYIVPGLGDAGDLAFGTKI